MTAREFPAPADAVPPVARDALLLASLRGALRAVRGEFADIELQELRDKGLAHHHVRLVGTGLIARLPKQSQMGLPAQANLDYQAACFARAAASGCTPRLAGVLPPSLHLPRGGLLVEEVVGRVARLPDDLPAIGQTLARIHGLALPSPAERAPLLDAPDPLAALADEIAVQARHLDAARLPLDSRRAIDAELAALRQRCAAAARPGRRLISFDAHPGNFIVRDDGRAMLVDLEKARYSHPPLDLAHATLITSTTWDLDTRAELSVAQVAAFYADWERALGGDAAPAWRAWHVPLRAAMWLWAMTWCAKWRVLSERRSSESGDGEDWSRENSQAQLVEHVRGRVDAYLSSALVDRVRAEFHELQRLFAA
jgi:thiamine kinase-like enzyme